MGRAPRGSGSKQKVGSTLASIGLHPRSRLSFSAILHLTIHRQRPRSFGRPQPAAQAGANGAGGLRTTDRCRVEGIDTLSTLVHPVAYDADYAASWKQEVNRRVAEHKKNKPSYAAAGELVREHRNDPASRAAQAAARVAARYANAPSYSEMLASEARAAMLAAEAASRAALAAQAAAQSVLNSLEAAASTASAAENANRRVEDGGCAEVAAMGSGSAGGPAAYESSARKSLGPGHEHTYAVRREPELPARKPAPLPVRARQAPGLFDSTVPEWPEPGSPDAESQLDELAQPIHGNLIEFPRQLVATRKVRPRRVEGPLANAACEAQLSIFEVDPGAISIDPETMPPIPAPDATAWSGPEWSGMQLNAHPQEEETLHQPAPAFASAPALDLASANRRLLAMVVDVSLVLGAFLLLAILVASEVAQFPAWRTVEIGSGIALLVAGALYQTLFFALERPTPGMWYAQLRLCTFEGNAPTRAQRNARLVALLLSALPMGLGLAWAIFDEDHLTWHDRLSHTYLRRC